MQIRIANRQDEKEIRELAEAFSKEENASFDLKGKDSDLVNVEANYFGRNGVFLVVEDDGKIKGFAGARENRKDGDVLVIERLRVAELDEGDEAASELMRVFREFAPRMLYKSIECGVDLEEGLLSKCGFKKDCERPSLKVAADF